ncbi:MAG: sigma-70 family RNA polymerase sigma factor [Sedimentisphaerales bacterium]
MGEKSTIKHGCDVSGDVQRAMAIFFEHYDFIRAVIRCKIKDESGAEDLLHNFFLSLVSRPIPAEVQDIKGYIYRAITNDVTDHVRSIKKYQAMTQKYANSNKIIVNNKPPLDALIEKEQTARMIELIRDRVTKSEFKAIASIYCDDLPLKEAADRLNINDRSVVRYISTGLRKVKRFLAFAQEVEDDSTQL